MRGRTATVAAWLACFDGHKEIFLLGFDGQHCEGYNNNIYVPSDTEDKHRTIEDHKIRQQMHELMTTYPGVDFYLVNNGESVYEEWRNCPNFQRMTYPQWVSYCDVQ
jgi:hypothetical protein